MLPGELDFTLYRGDDRRQPLVFRDEDSGLPMDLTGHEWACQVRHRHDEEIVAEFDVAVDEPGEGRVTLVMPAEETELLTSRGYVYDLESISPDGERQTWLYGAITVMLDVTRRDEELEPDEA
jgi:hypothetical protein